MSVALSQPMSVQEFLAWEERQELRWEFDGFAPVALTGGTFAHAVVQRNLVTALTNRLRGTSCQAIGNHFKIMVAGSIRYPDAMVIRRAVEDRAQFIDDPSVVFEILSPSTSYTDRIVKNRECRATPAILRYVLLEQDHPGATVFLRKGGWDWVSQVLLAEDTLTLQEIGIEVPLAELYEGVTFEDPSANE